MEAQVPQRHVDQFKPHLREGVVYFIKFFQVFLAKNNYRAVDHIYMIKFTGHTEVIEFPGASPTFPKYAYTLASFDTLRTRIDYTRDMSGNYIFIYILHLPFLIYILSIVIPSYNFNKITYNLTLYRHNRTRGLY
jgi:hypothetical protein